MPRLGDNTPDAAGLALRPDLTLQDLRQIFGDINRNGRCDGLVPFFQAPDSELLPVVGVFNRQFYRELDSPRGLVQALRDAIGAQAFSHLAAMARTATTGPDYPDEAELVLDLMGRAGFADLARRDRGWIAPPWTDALAGAWTASGQAYKPSQPAPPGSPPPLRVIFQDVAALLAKAPLRAKGEAIASRWEATGLPSAIFRAGAALAQASGQAAFEGLGVGLSRLLAEPVTVPGGPPSNQLARLVSLVDSAHQPTDGLFSAAAQRLREEPADLHKAAIGLQPLVPQAVFGYLKQQLAGNGKGFWLGLVPPEGGPSQSFLPFFIAARTAIEQVTGSARADDMGFDLPIYLNAYVLTLWAQKVAAANQTAWAAEPEAGFEARIWSLGGSVSAQQWNLIEQNPPGTYKLAASAAADFVRIGLGDFADAVSTLIAHDGFGNFAYQIEAVQGELGSTMLSALETLDRARTFADAAATVQSLIAPLVALGPDGKCALDRLESNDLLQDLQLALGGLTDSGWQNVRGWIFEGLGLGNLPPATRQEILDFYTPSASADASRRTQLAKLRQKASDLLDLMALFSRLDRSDSGLPGPLTWYRQILAFTDQEQKKVLGDTLALLGESAIFSEKKTGTATTPVYPGVSGWVADGSALARALFATAFLPAASYADLERVLNGSLALGGAATHLELAADLIARHPKGAAALVEALSGATAPFPFPESSRAWLVEFLGDPDFPTLWNFLSRYDDRRTSLSLARELEKLHANGELHEGFGLMQYLKNDRVRELGQFLGQWEQSGELAALFDAWDRFLAPATPPSPTAHR